MTRPWPKFSLETLPLNLPADWGHRFFLLLFFLRRFFARGFFSSAPRAAAKAFFMALAFSSRRFLTCGNLASAKSTISTIFPAKVKHLHS